MRPSFILNLLSQGSSEALSLGSKQLERVITPSVAQALRTNGFAVVDGVLGSACSGQLVEEMHTIRNTPHMIRNATHLVKDGATRLLEKERIWEMDPLSKAWPEVTKTAATFGQLNTDFTLGTLLNVHLPELCLDSQALKVQWNDGDGGCFPLHFDSDRDLDRRQVTAVVYLNEGWEPEDGGQIVMYPFPSAPVAIEPVMDRMVLFSSPNMLHRVLPSRRPRMCFSVWFSSTKPPSRTGLAPAAVAGASATELLGDHRYRRMLARAAYAEEWAESIRQSHAESDARALALDAHWKDVGIISRVFSNVLPEVLAMVDPPSESSAGGAARPPFGVKWLDF
uniref:Prolyl 4-hydroxylase alpha subunit domain-containing protein n=1 Tax=Pyramimonas obovata TaxID=1411642 RepID=A0A7S0WU31_9CHLO|mmetsp:Transcript_4177/g.8602  ORF Transcript_4177/g.8602 Transcript_4177/m.8602 type:complete len:338 (+) Transcript_4177:612-1625(+)